jgi:omega-6 fatty acid desaturase (delta-12 desaturase)
MSSAARAAGAQGWGADEVRSLRDALAPYRKPSTFLTLWNVGNSVVPFVACMAAAALVLPISYWISLPFMVLAAGFNIRNFIIMHDAGHGTLFRSRRMNGFVGHLTGILALTPMRDWAHNHAIHHAHSGDLDRRTNTDIQTITVAEYRSLKPMARLGYRAYRNPLVLLLFGWIWSFVLNHRLPRKITKGKGRSSMLLTNIGVAAMIAAMLLFAGWRYVVLVYVPMIGLAGLIGVWLFYMQHQFEDVYWSRHEDWAFVRAAMDGASYLRLPAVLQWFTGNIGFHHIHHLDPRIPYYYLPRCHRSHPLMERAPVLTLFDTVKCFGQNLYDEDNGRMVSFRSLSASPA